MSNVLYKQYDPDVLKKLQKVQTEMLKDVLEVCEKYDLPCFLIYGTAIGAVRHKGSHERGAGEGCGQGRQGLRAD